MVWSQDDNADVVRNKIWLSPSQQRRLCGKFPDVSLAGHGEHGVRTADHSPGAFVSRNPPQEKALHCQPGEKGRPFSNQVVLPETRALPFC